MDHIAAGTYFEFVANIEAFDTVIDHDFRMLRIGIDCQMYTIFQNYSSNQFEIMMYFFNDYNRDPSISGDIVIYLKFICFYGKFIYS